MRRFLILTITLGLSLPLAAATKKAAPRSLTVDTHADTPTEYLAKPFDLGARNSNGMFDYVRMKEGGLDAEFLVAYVPKKYAGNGAAAFCMKIMETIHEMADNYPQHARLARTRTTGPTRRATTGSTTVSPRSAAMSSAR